MHYNFVFCPLLGFFSTIFVTINNSFQSGVWICCIQSRSNRIKTSSAINAFSWVENNYKWKLKNIVNYQVLVRKRKTHFRKLPGTFRCVYSPSSFFLNRVFQKWGIDIFKNTACQYFLLLFYVFMKMALLAIILGL